MSIQSKKDLLTPYNLSFHKNSGAYTFTTDRKVFYACGFSYLTPKLSPVLGLYDMEIYDFEFHASEQKARDERVSATIIEILKKFFINSNRVLLYVCDSSDGRARERQALFKQWHRNISDMITRDEVTIEVEDTGIIYGSILTRNDFQHRELLKGELFDPIRGIMVGKA